MENLLNQPKFRLLGLEINNCPIEMGMDIDRSIIKQCGLKRDSSRSWRSRQEEVRFYRSRNCVVSCFGRELRIEPSRKFIPYRNWFKTLVLFVLERDTLVALLIDFWSDGGGKAQHLLDTFEALGDKWLTRTYDRERVAKGIPSQKTMDALLNNVNLRPHGEWEINDTSIYSDLRGRRASFHPRGLCRIIWETKRDKSWFWPSDMFC